MASLKFGAIVTGIKGSVSGQTFRQTKNGWLVQNKQKRQNNSMASANSKFFQNLFYIKQWAKISNEYRDLYNELAASVYFEDKWGNLKYITGKELFVKLNCQRQNFPEIINPAGATSETQTFILDSIDVDFDNNILDVTVSTPIINGFVFFSAKLVSNTYNASTKITMPIVAKYACINSTKFFLFENFVDFFPNFQKNQKYIIQAKCVNAFGFQSVTTAFEVTII